MKPEWGVKRSCRKCAAHFYDLKRTTFECPKCNTNYSQADFLIKALKSEPVKNKKKAERVPVDEAIHVTDDTLDQAIDTDDLLEDADDFGDEEVADVIDHEDED